MNDKVPVSRVIPNPKDRATSPNPLPVLAAQRTPVKRSPVSFQTAAFNTCPPSKGRPGIRLNNAKTRLILAISLAMVYPQAEVGNVRVRT